MMFLVLVVLLSSANFEAERIELLRTEHGEITVLKENVQIVDEKTTIHAQTASLFQEEDIVLVSDSVRIRTGDINIMTDTAVYFLEKKQTELKGNVDIKKGDLVIRADSVIFDNRQDLVYSSGPLEIFEQKEKIELRGEEGEYHFADGVGFLKKSPVLIIKSSEHPIIVESRSMTFFNKARYAQAEDSVQVKTDETCMNCDSLFFYFDEDRGVAVGEPVLSEHKNRVSGDTLCFFIEDRMMKRIDVQPNAYGFYFTEKQERIEVEGDQISIFFEQEELERVVLTGNGQGSFDQTPQLNRKIEQENSDSRQRRNSADRHGNK